MPSENLKPCPFCGGNAVRITLEDEENFGGDVICCERCQASSHVEFGRKENLVDTWNRRTEAKQDDEPVAWRVTYASGEVVFLSDKPVGVNGVYECEPLFARPVSPTGRWSDYFDNIRDAIDGCQDADWDSEQAAKSVIRTLDYLNLAPPAPAARSGALKVDAETAREALRELAAVQMNLSLEDWCRISNTILAALEPAEPAPSAEPPADIIARVFYGWYGSNLDSGPFAAAAIEELERNGYFISTRPSSSEARLREALLSIANNMCCEGCQEAALVARAALKEASDD